MLHSLILPSCTMLYTSNAASLFQVFYMDDHHSLLACCLCRDMCFFKSASTAVDRVFNQQGLIFYFFIFLHWGNLTHSSRASSTLLCIVVRSLL